MRVDRAATPRRLLQQFARFPEAGRVKTRLMRELSATQACAVHEELMLSTAKALKDAELADCELWLDKIARHPCIDAVAARGFSKPQVQVEGDLGAKMLAALEQGLGRADQVVLVGSDCPGLDRAYLRAAFERLEVADVVLGPALDGGFVLIGCRKVHADMFEGVSWGGGSVLSNTLRSVGEACLSVSLLPERYDIDRPEDLRRWRAESRTASNSASRSESRAENG